MDLTTLQIAQREAILERIKHETLQVMMLKTKLKFTIDDRSPLPKEWRRELLRIGDPFTITDLRTGEIIFNGNTYENGIKDPVRSN